MSLIMSAYFVGFLGASRMVPSLIRRVGHVRVFAALASLHFGCAGAVSIIFKSDFLDVWAFGHRVLFLRRLYYR